MKTTGFRCLIVYLPDFNYAQVLFLKCGRCSNEVKLSSHFSSTDCCTLLNWLHFSLICLYESSGRMHSSAPDMLVLTSHSIMLTFYIT